MAQISKLFSKFRKHNTGRPRFQQPLFSFRHFYIINQQLLRLLKTYFEIKFRFLKIERFLVTVGRCGKNPCRLESSNRLDITNPGFHLIGRQITTIRSIFEKRNIISKHVFNNLIIYPKHRQIDQIGNSFFTLLCYYIFLQKIRPC